MMVGTGMGWGFGVLGGLAMVLFWVFIVAAVVWLVLTLARGQQAAGAPGRSGAVAILAERYARGEIDTEEFAARKRALEEGTR